MPSPTPTAQIQDLRLELEALKGRLASAEQELEKSNLMGLRERIAVLEKSVARLEEYKSEGDRRHWQFIYIFVGALVALFSSVVVNLLLYVLKK